MKHPNKTNSRHCRCKAPRKAWRVALILSTALGINQLQASDRSWVGPANGAGDWFEASNWLPLIVPEAGDVVTVDNGGTIAIGGGDAFASMLTLGDGTSGFGRITSGGLSATQLIIARQAGATGVFAQTDGSVTLLGPQSLVLGRDPGASGEYVLSGGLLQVGSQAIIGKGGAGTLTISGTAIVHPNGGIQLGGSVSDPETGVTSYGSGTLNMSGGDVRVQVSVGDEGTGMLNQSGGILFRANVGPKGTVNHTGGQNSLGFSVGGSSPSVHGVYNLSGAGQIGEPEGSQAYIGAGGYGVFNQTGGAAYADNISVGMDGKYALSAGVSTARVVTLGSTDPTHPGLFQQTGGVATFTNLNLGVGGLYQYSAGSLTIRDSMLLTGTFDFTGSAVTLTIQPTGTGAGLNFSQGQFINSSSASLVIQGADSLAQFPAGYDPSAHFANYSNAGLTYVVGTPLTIPADRSIRFVGDIADHVTVAGTLAAPGINFTVLPLNLGAGVTITGIGSVDLQGGRVNVSDMSSGVSGDGQLSASNMTVSSASGASFIQTGGGVSLRSNPSLILGRDVGTSGSYVLSGGTLDLGFGPAVVGKAGSGTLTISGTAIVHPNGGIQLGGSVSDPETGITSYGSGTLNMSGGDVRVQVSVGDEGTGMLNQSGGILFRANVGPKGTVNHTGGQNSLGFSVGGSSPSVHGVYNLSGAGQIGEPEGSQASIGAGGYGVFNQTGGAAYADNISVGMDGKYALSAGVSTARVVTLGSTDPAHPGLFQQTGGVATFTNLNLSVGGLYQYSAGSLTIRDSMLLTGTFDFTGSAVTLTIQPTGTGAGLNFSQGQFINSSSASLVIQGADSLAQFPAGYDPSAHFANYSNAGLTYVVGTPLTIPADRSIRFVGDIADHVTVAGTLAAPGVLPLNLGAGVTVTGTGSVELQGGKINVSDMSSGVSGDGQLSASNITVSSASGAAFTQSGGGVSLYSNSTNQLLILGRDPGTSGTYVLSGGTLGLGSQAIIGKGGAGTLTISGTAIVHPNGGIQLGGSVSDPETGITSYGSGTLNMSGGDVRVQVSVGDEGTGMLNQSGGILFRANVGPKGTVNHTGGQNSLGFSVGGSSPSVHGVYNLSGAGQIGEPEGSQAYIGAGGYGVFNQTGGAAYADNISVGMDGKYALSAGVATGRVVTLGSTDPAHPGLFQQTGGVATFDNVSIQTGGKIDLRGGQFNVTKSLQLAGGTFDYSRAARPGELLAAGSIEIDAGGALLLGNGPMQVPILFNAGGTLTQASGMYRTLPILAISGGTTTVNSGATLSGDLVQMVGGHVHVNPGAVFGSDQGEVRIGGAGAPIIQLSADADDPGVLSTGGVYVTPPATTTTARINTTAVSPGQIPGTVDLGGRSQTFEVWRGTSSIDLSVGARLTHGRLIKSGTGILELSNPANDFTSGVLVNDGTVIISSPSSFSGGVTAAAFGSTFGTVQVSNDAVLGSPSNAITLAGGYLSITGTFASARQVILGDAQGNGSGGISVSSGNTFTAITPVAGLSGMTKRGAGTLQLNGVNPYSGFTRISEGVLALGPTASINALSVLTIESAGTLRVGSGIKSLGSLFGSGTLTVDNGTISLGSLGAVTQFSGSISGSGALVKVGAGTTTLSGPLNVASGLFANFGTLILSGSNAFAGGVAVAGGCLRVFSDSNLGQPTNSIELSSGTLQYGGSLATSRSINLLGAGGALDITSGNVLTSSGLITGSGMLRKAGTGTLILSASSPYSGVVKLDPDGGALRLSGAGGALPAAAQIQVGIRSSFELDNLTGNATTGDRVSDAATFTFNGGLLSMRGVANDISSELLGPLVLASSSSTIAMQSGLNGTASLSFASLQRTIGATLNITGADIGTTNRVLLRTAPGAIGAWLKVNGLAAKYDVNGGLVPTSFPLPGPVMGTLWGDANLDGWVNGYDLSIVDSRMGLPGDAWGEGDFNGDGWVTQGDLYLLLGNLNRPGLAVPEPASIAWAVIMPSLGISSRRRRRQSAVVI